MGVIYKFKDEVVNFVLDQKQQNPGLSCRQLAAVVSRVFDLQVSKSSVNAILKSAQLSSPVGRRALSEKKSKPFQIPSVRKKEIFGPPPPAEPPAVKKPVIPKPKVVKHEEPAAPKPHVMRPVADVKMYDLSHQPAPSPSSPVYDGMGNIFLKAVEWSLSSKPVLGEILKDYSREFSAEDVYAASEILIYLRSFGMSGIDDLAQYRGSGLWKLNQLSTGFNYQTVKNVFQSLNNLDEIGFKLCNEIDQVFTAIKYFKIICEDGQEILIDAQGETVLNNNVHSDKSSLYNKLLSNLTAQIISPQKPTILQKAPGQSGLAKEFYDLLMAYENKPGKKIATVSLFDANGAELSRFSSIPAQKRFFIIGLWPWQKEYDLLVGQVAGHREKIPHPLTNQNISFCEINRQALADATRHICSTIHGYALYLEDEKGPQNIILTNMTQSQISAREVVSSYLVRWPNFQEAKGKDPAAGTAQHEDILCQTSDFWESLNIFVRKMEQQACKQFFAHIPNSSVVTEFISMCYKISGHWQEYKDYSLVSLIPPGDIILEKVRLLHEAAGHFNQADIVDPSGKRVFLKIL